MSEIRQIAAILHRNVQEPQQVKTAAVKAGG
jgi:hypothetical protein